MRLHRCPCYGCRTDAPSGWNPSASGSVVGAVLGLSLVAAVALLASCGASAPTVARQVVTAADNVQIAGVRSFKEFDDMHQDALLASSDPAVEVRAKVQAYRAQQKRVVLAFHALANASHAAKATIDAYEAGRVRQVDWGALVTGVVSSARALKNIADAIPVKIPGLDVILGLVP